MARDMTDAEYADMAADYAKNPVRADEVEEVTVNPAYLKSGRPPKGSSGRGKTPTTSLRLPTEMRERVDSLAVAHGVKSGEIIRRAVAEYIDRHPAVSPPPAG